MRAVEEEHSHLERPLFAYLMLRGALEPRDHTRDPPECTPSALLESTP